MGQLDGKVAIITGAGAGIGAATARLMAAAGASVAVVDIRTKVAVRVTDEITAAGGSALAVTADVKDEEQVRSMIAETVKAFGGLHVLHNNAAALHLGLVDVPVADLPVEVWDESFAVNARGPMLGCKHAIPAMLDNGGGSIINTSADGGLAGDYTRPSYGSSKGAVNSLTQYVAAQYGKSGIRCNAIAPGLIVTDGVRRSLTDEVQSTWLRHHLTPRLGTPDDIGHLAVFLASDLAGFITGQVFPVDGGLLSHTPWLADMQDMTQR